MNKTQKFFLLAIVINSIYLAITFIFFYYLDSPLMSSDNNDYLTFHNAGLIVITDISNLYNSSLYLFPFRYFPISAYIFTPFSILGLKLGYFIFQIFNFFLNIVIIYLIYAIIKTYKRSSKNDINPYELKNFKDILKKKENESILHQCAILLIMLPQFMNYFLGQINTLVSFFILSSLLYFLKDGIKNDFLGGLLLGIGILIKPTLILILPFILFLNYNRENRKLTFQFKKSFIRLLGPLILMTISGFYFLVYPQMLEDFIEVNLAGKYTYNIGGNLEINPSFSLTRIFLILFSLIELNINSFFVFIIITLIILFPIYILFITSENQHNNLIDGYFIGITVMLVVYFDSWPHHIIVLAPFLIFFFLFHKDFELYKIFKSIYYLLAILMVIFWGLFFLTYQIFPFNIGGLSLIMLVYFLLIYFYKHKLN